MFDDIKKFFTIGADHRRELATRENDPWEGFATTASGVLLPEEYDDLIRKKGRGRGVHLYRSVSKDARLGALLDKRKSGVLKNRFEVTPGGDRMIDKRAAALCKLWLNEINAYTFMRGLLNSTLFGYAVTELVWAPNAFASGYWLPVITRSKQPERFAFTGEFDLRLLTYQATTEGEPVMPGKFVIARHDPDNDNPYGTPLGYPLWWLLYFRSNGVRFWSSFVQRFGAPAVVFKYPSGGKSAQDKKAIAEAAAAFRRDTGIIIPDNVQLEMLNMQSGSRSDVHQSFLAWLSEEAAVRVLGSTLTTTMSGSSGSRAAGEVHERASDAVIFQDAVMLEEVVSNQCFRWITDINIGANARAPKLRFDLPSLEMQILRAERDKALMEQGVKPATPAEYYNTHFGMNIDEEFYAASRDAYLRLPGARQRGGTSAGKQPANFALSENLRGRKDALSEASSDIEKLADLAADEAAQRLRQELLDEVGDTVNAEEFEQLLTRKMTEDPPQWLRDHMRDAMLMAHMAGEYPEHAHGLLNGDEKDENPNF